MYSMKEMDFSYFQKQFGCELYVCISVFLFLKKLPEIIL
jgi:hypothetical protein